MAQEIDFVKKELTAYRIMNRCSFIETQRERKWMMNAIRQAFQWAEKHSDSIDPEAPYCIVREKPGEADSDN